jgi:phenylacetate-CoA ligase
MPSHPVDRRHVSGICSLRGSEFHSPLALGDRQAIETAFAAPLLNSYAASETGSIAHSYPGLSGLYLTEDTTVYEPVDAENRPVPPGTPAAKLLVTNVINQVLPLIRYELTDEVTVLTEPNPGPWTGRRIAEPQGRFDDNFTYAGGVTVHPATFWIPLVRPPEIAEYQVHQTPRGAAVAVHAPAGIDLEPVRREIVEALQRAGIADPTVTVAAVEHLDRLPAGKFKRFYPLPN